MEKRHGNKLRQDGCNWRAPMGTNKTGLQWMLKKQNISNVVRQKTSNDAPLVEGQLSFDTLPSDVKVHCCDTVEKQNAKSSAELSPCLSINVLLEGKLNFSLGNGQFEFDAQDKPAVLFVNVIGQTEVFTRRLVENQRVKKVNVCIDKQWLLNRSQSTFERQQIEVLFNQGCQVFQPEFPAELCKLSQDLIDYKQVRNFEGEIQVELIALKIIAMCIPLLLTNDTSSLAPTYQATHFIEQDVTFFQAFNVMALQELSLSVIAVKLGVSVSTLQRKVKSRYQLTAIEYIRYKKLDNAKASLIIDDLSIGEIAYIAGYSHVSNFVTAFKKRFNMTPTQFREGHIDF
jgi:AraC-like DNA-binding protein